MQSKSLLTHSAFLLIVILMSGLNAADDWTQKTPTTKPSARRHHDMAYIGEDQVLLFGGYDSAYDDETWIYDLSDNTWTQKSPATKPSARTQHAMAYIGGDQVLFFGGYDGSTGKNDSWVYDLSDNTWTQKSPATGPSVRYDHSLAYIGGDQVLLFGGHDSNANRRNDSWVYDLSDNTWTQKSPATKPSARADHSLAYIGGDQLLLFGGNDGAYDDETWIYDLSDNTWTQKSPATKPPARGECAMAYIGSDQVVLFGGWRGTYDDETWVYDLSANTWTQDSNTSQPSARYASALSETSMDGSSYPVLFSGYYGTNDDETWTFGGGDYLLTDITPPASPGGLTATPGDGQVTLTWTANSESDLASYKVYGGTSSSPTTLLSTVTSGQTYTHSSLTNGTTYYYRITAVDNAGNESGYSTEKSAMPHNTDASYSLNFDGVDDYASITHSSELVGMSELTIQFYLKLDLPHHKLEPNHQSPCRFAFIH